MSHRQPPVRIGKPVGVLASLEQRDCPAATLHGRGAMTEPGMSVSEDGVRGAFRRSIADVRGHSRRARRTFDTQLELATGHAGPTEPEVVAPLHFAIVK